MKTGFFFLLAICGLCSVSLRAQDVDVGSVTPMQVRLQTPLSSRHSQPGDAIEAVVISPVVVAERIVVPSGTILKGRVAEVRQLRRRKNPAGLLLEFHTLIFPGGREAHVNGRVIAIDNARESVAPSGWIDGRFPPRVKPSKIELPILFAAILEPEFLAVIEGVPLLRREASRVNIRYLPGMEFTVGVPEFTPAASSATRPDEPVPDSELSALVNDLPSRLTAHGSKVPADFTNVLVVGSRTEIEKAFETAGWTRAASTSLTTMFKAFMALARLQSYQSAPVSRLFLGGRPADLVFEKQNDTIVKRHHIRLWQQAATSDGRQVWVGAATHDIGVQFSASRAFKHRIEGDIDSERSKVVNDLVFGGYAAYGGLVDRQFVPSEGVNATGDRVHTDARIAIVTLLSQPAP